MNCSLLKRHIWVFISCFTVAFGSFGLWQYHLYQKLSKTDISCGSDWSYMVRCPIGSYCRSLGQGPLAGGLCKAWLSSVLEIFRGWGEQRRVSTPTPIPILSPTLTPEPTPLPISDPTANWRTYKNEKYRFTLKYPNDYTLEEETTGDLMLFLNFWFDQDRAPFHLYVSLNKNMFDLEAFYEELEKENLSGDPISPFGQTEPLIKKLQSGETVYYFKGVYCVVTCDKAVWAKTDKVYEFVNSYYNIPQQDSIFDQIFSTLKFLD